MDVVILGLSVTSSWGNGHATTYRSLIKGLHQRGHSVLFLERDKPWYAENRDLAKPGFCEVSLYQSASSLNRFADRISCADLVIVGSYVPEGVEVSRFVFRKAKGITAFYDIDTPVTYSKLKNGDFEYLSPEIIPRFDFYFSFTGGRTLDIFHSEFGAKNVKPLYCSVDPEHYFPSGYPKFWDLGYMGTYSEDRQPGLNELMLKAAEKFPSGKFIVAGPQFPAHIKWPLNVKYIRHIAPFLHNKFYNKQKFTLNITRQDMIRMGYSPSVRLFEAAACGVPVISDYWEGLETFFVPGTDIYLSSSADETVKILQETSEKERTTTGQNAMNRVLRYHTGEKRAEELEQYVSLEYKNIQAFNPAG